MAKYTRNSVDILLSRAMEPDTEANVRADKSPEKRPQTVVPEPPTRPMFYKGTMPEPDGDVSPASLYRNRSARKTAKRKVSTFNLILMLFAAAAGIVLYVGNIIAVDQLTVEVNVLKTRHRKILNEQEILKAELNRLTSLERINRKAAEELGLVTPKTPPVWLDIDPEKIDEVQEALRKK